MMISETVTGRREGRIVTALHQRYGADDVVFPDGDRLPSEKDPPGDGEERRRNIHVQT